MKLLDIICDGDAISAFGKIADTFSILNTTFGTVLNIFCPNFTNGATFAITCGENGNWNANYSTCVVYGILAKYLSTAFSI